MKERYFELLIQWNKEISSPGWQERLLPLQQEMDRIWSKLKTHEREECLDFASQLYYERIK